MEQTDYEKLRDKCIETFKVVYKDSLAFDYNEVPKDVRIRLLEDPTYIAKTKALKAGLFIEQLNILDGVLAGAYQGERPTDQSGNVLRALELKQKLLLEDLNVTKDESTALNVTYVAMTREDFEALETVEVSEGGNSVELGADFGVSEDNDSFEARLKAKTKEKMDRLKDKEGEE
jgi:hypothetical protein